MEHLPLSVRALSELPLEDWAIVATTWTTASDDLFRDDNNNEITGTELLILPVSPALADPSLETYQRRSRRCRESTSLLNVRRQTRSTSLAAVCPPVIRSGVFSLQKS